MKTAAAALLALLLGCGSPKERPPLRLIVMDPLAAPLACDCVAGHGQRDYRALAAHLQRALRCRVTLVFTESLTDPRLQPLTDADIVIGKTSVVQADLAAAGLKLRPVAALTDKTGALTVHGLFVVRREDAAASVADLASHRLLIGPPEADETHAAALATLENFRLPAPPTNNIRTGGNMAALDVVERRADAAVISSYAMPLLTGCGVIESNALRVVGRTDPVPFISVFAAENRPGNVVGLLLTARQRALLEALESRDGFLPLSAHEDWPDWRGPNRDGFSQRVPDQLASKPRLLWRRTLTGPGMSGLAVAEGRVMVADKDLDNKRDVFRCLDAWTGRELWSLRYDAEGELDFTNSPRATPVVREGRVWLLGAFGDLHCVELATGKILWRRHLARDFQATPPKWGYAATPLWVDGKLIVQPGGRQASIVALDPVTGRTLWATPGEPAAYAAPIVGTFGGRRQIVGYDEASLGGWDIATGRRLWKLVPPNHGDFNVPTPVNVNGRLLLATENNGTRLYDFDAEGNILPAPVARSDRLSPDTSTPVVSGGLVFGGQDSLVCLDARTLALRWEDTSEDFAHYNMFLASPRSVLVITQAGKLRLLAVDGRRPVSRGAQSLFEEEPATERDVWSHPALCGNRLYIRNQLGVYCFLLETAVSPSETAPGSGR